MRLLSFALAAVIVAMVNYGAYFYQQRYQPAVKALAALKAREEGCRQRLAALEQDKRALADQLEGARQALASYEGQVTRIQEEHTQRLQELQQALQEKDRLIQELQDRLSQQIKASARVQREGERMREEIERLKTAVRAAEAHAYMLEQMGVKKQKALEAQREEQVEALQEKDRRIQELELRARALEEDRARLEEALLACQKENGELRKTVEELSQVQLASPKGP